MHTVTNMVEVFINSRGTPNTRCPSNSLYQKSDAEVTRASGSKSCESDGWNQVRDTWPQVELTPVVQTSSGAQSKHPVLRRWV